MFWVWHKYALINQITLFVNTIRFSVRLMLETTILVSAFVYISFINITNSEVKQILDDNFLLIAGLVYSMGLLSGYFLSLKAGKELQRHVYYGPLFFTNDDKKAVSSWYYSKSLRYFLPLLIIATLELLVLPIPFIDSLILLVTLLLGYISVITLQIHRFRNRARPPDRPHNQVQDKPKTILPQWLETLPPILLLQMRSSVNHGIQTWLKLLITTILFFIMLPVFFADDIMKGYVIFTLIHGVSIFYLAMGNTSKLALFLHPQGVKYRHYIYLVLSYPAYLSGITITAYFVLGCVIHGPLIIAPYAAITPLALLICCYLAAFNISTRLDRFSTRTLSWLIDLLAVLLFLSFFPVLALVYLLVRTCHYIIRGRVRYVQ